jgi:hypothetical protein
MGDKRYAVQFTITGKLVDEMGDIAVEESVVMESTGWWLDGDMVEVRKTHGSVAANAMTRDIVARLMTHARGVIWYATGRPVGQAVQLRSVLGQMLRYMMGKI